MVDPSYIHLRLHTEFSISDGILRIKDLCKAAEEDNMPAIAITDLSNLFGMVKFSKEARKCGIKPIIGCDVWVTNPKDRQIPFRVLLLVQNKAGYLKLCEWLTQAYLSNQYQGRPEIKKDWFRERGTDGVIALSGAQFGEVGVSIGKKNMVTAEEAAKDFFNYSLDLLDERRKTPKDDMITRLSQVSENNVYLTDQQIICTIILLLNAGHEATVNTLGNGLNALITNEIDFEEIKSKEIATKDVVEELIRWDSPLQFFQRYVLEDTEIGGYDLPKKSKVAILLGSANRDAEQFNIPEEINFQREEKDHSSWGGGIHFCIGAHLARLELEVSFNHILNKNFALKENPERTGAFGIRGFKELLVSTST